MAIPLTANNQVLIEIFNRIADLPLGVPVMDEVALQRDKRQAEQWARKNPGLVNAILGHTASLQGHEESMREHFQTALRIEPRDVTTINDYIASLLSFGQSSEAADLADHYYTAFPLVKQLHEKVITANVFAGRIQKAAKWLDAWNETAFGPVPFDGPAIVKCNQLLVKNGITDDEVEALQKMATTLLHENNQPIMGCELLFLEDEYDQFIDLSYQLWLPVEQVVELELAHTSRFVEHGFTPASELVNFSYRPRMNP